MPIPRCEHELKDLSDEAVAEMFDRNLDGFDHNVGGNREHVFSPDSIAETVAIVMACGRELERRGREDLLQKLAEAKRKKAAFSR